MKLTLLFMVILPLFLCKYLKNKIPFSLNLKSLFLCKYLKNEIPFSLNLKSLFLCKYLKNEIPFSPQPEVIISV